MNKNAPFLITLLSSLTLSLPLSAQELSTAKLLDSTTPQGLVEHFYSQLHAAKFSGLPTTAQLAQLSPFLASDLLSLLQRAQEVEHYCASVTPDGDKPHMIEGDVFSGSNEPYSEVAYGKLRTQGSSSKLALQFIYTDTRFPPAHHFRNFVWPAEAILRREKSTHRWVLNDLQFTEGRSLRRDLSEFLRTAKHYCQAVTAPKK